MPLVTRIATATQLLHKDICKIAKQSKYTKDYSNLIFSGTDCYAQGRIRVLTVGGVITGFTCVRKRKRDGIVVLYFMGVEQEKRGAGFGGRLMADLFSTYNGCQVELKVMKDNPACRLYERNRFVQLGEAYEGKAWVMRREVQ